MKKLSLFALFILAIQTGVFALSSPTVIWPLSDGYYVEAGTEN